MRDEPGASDSDPTGSPAPWWQRFESITLTPWVFAAFFVVLAMMSAAATGVGYLVHHLARHH